MNQSISEKISEAIIENISVKTKMLSTSVNQIEKCGLKLSEIIKKGGKILFCGNGGSAADSQHLAAELVVRLRSKFNRPSIPAIALTVDSSILTACGNDFGFEHIFSRQVQSYGTSTDALIAITTSGNSDNVLKAVLEAKKIGMFTIGLLGGNGGKLINECDEIILVPSNNTARIQEAHIMVGHIWCEIIEENVYPELVTE